MDILIVEDEVYNQRLLAGMLNNLRPGWKISGIIDSVRETVNYLAKTAPDLIFMDIQLIDGVCFSIFDQTKTDCPVIFTTAYDNYAIQAFKINSIDYLLKPIKESELEHAIQKFETLGDLYRKASLQVDYKEIMDAIQHGKKKYRTRFLVQGNSAYYKLNTQEIAYFYSENKITFAVTFNKKEHIVDYTLDALEEELDPDIFFRANRSTVLHIEAIYKIENYYGGKLYVKLLPELSTEVVVSRLKNAIFKEWAGR